MVMFLSLVIVTYIDFVMILALRDLYRRHLREHPRWRPGDSLE